MADQTSRYADRTYGGTTYSAPPTGYVGFEAPWHIAGVRVDGLSADNPLSPITPGQTVTYQCTFVPQPANGDPDDDHIQRFLDLREYLIRAPDVLTYDPPGTDVFYREQHNSQSSLVRIEPLQTDHDGTFTGGNPPPTRDSIHGGRWGVVTGGEARSPLGDRDRPVQLALETVTIASVADYPDRQTMEAAAERNDFA